EARAKGAGQLFRRNRDGNSIPSGWGVRPIPAHCHPLQAGGALSGTKGARTRRVVFFSLAPALPHWQLMNVFELTRALIDIESITNNEERVGNFLYDYLAPIAARHGGRMERMEVEPRRFNVFAQWGEPLLVTLSTHMDTVPPYIASREDDDYIWGRGACDTKGIIASMIEAVEALLAGGQRGIGLLFVVGEERNSAGADKA